MTITRDVLARTVWSEDRSGGLPGMQAVAAVVINRASAAKAWMAEHNKAYHPEFGNGSIAGVCLMHAQFGGWLQTDPNFPEIMADDWEAKPGSPGAMLVADQAISGNISDPTDGALFYYASTIPMPGWAVEMAETARIGGHIFLRPQTLSA